jgi:hypothetical protein
MKVTRTDGTNDLDPADLRRRMALFNSEECRVWGYGPDDGLLPDDGDLAPYLLEHAEEIAAALEERERLREDNRRMGDFLFRLTQIREDLVLPEIRRRLEYSPAAPPKRYFVDDQPPAGFAYKWAIKDRQDGGKTVGGAGTKGTAERICRDLNEHGFSEAWD